MRNDRFKALFLCTGNSARSIMAGAVMNRLGRERFEALSAGTHPRGDVHPAALDKVDPMSLSEPATRGQLVAWRVTFQENFRVRTV